MTEEVIYQEKFNYLLNKVARMRELQKKYFQKKDEYILIKSIQAEKDVDEFISHYKTPKLKL